MRYDWYQFFFDGKKTISMKIHQRILYTRILIKDCPIGSSDGVHKLSELIVPRGQIHRFSTAHQNIPKNREWSLVLEVAVYQWYVSPPVQRGREGGRRAKIGKQRGGYRRGRVSEWNAWMLIISSVGSSSPMSSVLCSEFYSSMCLVGAPMANNFTLARYFSIWILNHSTGR